MNIRQNHQIILRYDKSGMVEHVDAIDICTDGVKIHAGCELAVIIGKGRSKGYSILAKLGAAVLSDILIGIVVIYGGNGGLYSVLIVVAVDELNIVQIYSTGCIALGISREALSYQTDGVVAKHLEGAIALSFQAGSNIDPALARHILQRGGGDCFAVFIYICIAVGQINSPARRLNDALERVSGSALRNIDPHAKRRG